MTSQRPFWGRCSFWGVYTMPTLGTIDGSAEQDFLAPDEGRSDPDLTGQIERPTNAAGGVGQMVVTEIARGSVSFRQWALRCTYNNAGIPPALRARKRDYQSGDWYINAMLPPPPQG